MRPVPEAAVGAVRETLREHGEPVVAGAMTFMQARTANEVLKAQERRVRLQRMKGELIDRAKATAQVFRLARDERDAAARALGFAATLQFAPTLLLTLWAGVLADRHDKRTMLFLTQSAMSSIALFLWALTAAGVMGNSYEKNQHERLADNLGFGRDWIAQVKAADGVVFVPAGVVHAFGNAGSAPARSRTASSLAVSTVKLPEITPLPPRIGSRIRGELITLSSSTIASSSPMFSEVRSPKISAPCALNRNSTSGRFWRSKLTRASTR